MKARTRVAPSPTGFPHLGTLYQAIIDKAIALKTGGQFILRIEDTDQSRTVTGAVEAIYALLENFNLSPDESPIKGGEYGPYIQSQRLEIYKKYAEQLVSDGNAYYCFCSKDRLEKLREEQEKAKKVPMYDKHCRHLSKEDIQRKLESGDPYVIRMKMPENQKIIVKDLLRGDIEFDSNGIDDQVILKADGFPTYHLAADETNLILVVEDHRPEGGIAEAVRSCLIGSKTPVHSLSVTKMPKSGSPEELLDFEQINKNAIVNKVRELLI
jgi:glutamyl-tRNA synthetase